MLDVHLPDTAKPLPFDALHVGDLVRVQLDVLAEQGRTEPGLPPTWHFMPAGMQGTLLGFRERAGETFGIIELMLGKKIVMYVREHKLTRVRHAERPMQALGPAEVSRAPTPRRRLPRHRG